MIKRLLSLDLKAKRVLMRVDFNVPVQNGRVTDDFRLRAILPTIQHCLKQGAGIVLMSHLGRPGGIVNEKYSLMPVGETLADLLEMPIKFSSDCVSSDARNTSIGIGHGDVHLLENLRFHNGETENDSHFAEDLARHGQVYINDAFGTAHRAHASNVSIVDFFNQKGIGFLMEKELMYLKSAFEHPARPVTLVLGGAKIDSKLSLIQHFTGLADHILIGGGMSFTFLKASGREVGNSLVDDRLVATAKEILQRGHWQKSNLLLPVDFVCGATPTSPASGTFTRATLPVEMMGLDIGPETIKKFQQILLQSETILWNGPMGVFENEDYAAGSRAVAETMVAITAKNKTTIVGGGDTAAAIRQFGLYNGVTHVSTGGGASLELLSGKTLPAFNALEIT